MPEPEVAEESETVKLRREILATSADDNSILRPDLVLLRKETFQKILSYLARQIRVEAGLPEPPADG